MTDLVKDRAIATRAEPTIRFGGHTIRAPGFDELTFAAAVNRAFSDGLAVSPGRAPRSWYVRNPTNGSEYVANRHGCSCRAGELARPCKHRSIILVIEAIIVGHHSVRAHAWGSCSCMGLLGMS
jgi:hypothetical protein